MIKYTIIFLERSVKNYFEVHKNDLNKQIFPGKTRVLIDKKIPCAMILQ